MTSIPSKLTKNIGLYKKSLKILQFQESEIIEKHISIDFMQIKEKQKKKSHRHGIIKDKSCNTLTINA